jgi:hypothetical protein
MTTKMVVNDEKQDTISPLLPRPTYDDIEVIEIESSNDNQSVLPVNNNSFKSNGKHVILLDENIFKSMTISFEKINYIIGQTTNIKSYQKWKKIFSSCKRTRNKQILFDLSGIFKPGMNAILGMCHFY